MQFICDFGKYRNPLVEENEPTKQEDTKETAKYDHPQDIQPPVTYETVTLHEETSGDMQSAIGATNSIYEEIPNKAHDGMPNPSYDTPQLPTKIDHS